MFDADEEKEAPIGLNSRSILALLPLFATTVFALLVFHAWAGVGMYAPSEREYVAFLEVLQILALGFIWLSVGLAHIVYRRITVIAILLAVLLTSLWWLGYFYTRPQWGI